MGCRNAACPLCTQCQHRRCNSEFNGKYLAGDVLKANCGADIRVEVRTDGAHIRTDICFPRPFGQVACMTPAGGGASEGSTGTR